jgi:hypothetical protein
MANELAALLAGSAAPVDPNLAPISQELQTAQGLTAQSLSGAPVYRTQAIANVISGLAGAYLKSEANRDLSRYSAGGIDAVSKSLPENHALQPLLKSDNPFVQQLGLRAVPDALKQLGEAKGLRPGETLQFPNGGPPIAANTGGAAAAVEAAKNAPLIARAGGEAKAKAQYESGGEGTRPGPNGPETFPMTAATRAAIQPGAEGPAGTPAARAGAGQNPAAVPSSSASPAARDIPSRAMTNNLQPEVPERPAPAAAPAATFAERYGVGGQPVKTPEFEGRVEGEKGAMKEFVENSTKHYDAAQNLMGRLTTMDHNIEALGPKWMGAGANAKGEFGKQWNGLLDTAGVKGYHIDPTKIATWEEFNKESSRAGMELINANFGGSREAASIIKMGTEAVPAAQQTYLGAKYNAASIRAAAQREIDLHEFKSDLLQHGKSIVNADPMFNKANPPERYAMRGITSLIPPEAVAHLRANPALAPQFDKQFGAGTAAFLTGGK